MADGMDAGVFGPSPVEAGPPGREITDTAATRQGVYDSVLTSLRELPPVTDGRHVLSLTDVDFAEPEKARYRDRKKAFLRGESLTRRLKGTWNLHDATTGKLIDSRTATVARVPTVVAGGSMVLSGVDYGLGNQLRLKGGAYARVTHAGDVETHVNVPPGKGLSHHYTLNPATGLFKIRAGQAEVPLAPLLKAMGVSDEQMRTAWGADVARGNPTGDSRGLERLFDKFVKKPDPTKDRHTQLAEAYAATPLDAQVTARTLGHPHDRTSPEAVLAATTKLLKVSRGEAEPDDRDEMSNQTLYGPEDLFRDRARKAGGVMRRLLWKAAKKGTLGSMPPDALGPLFRGAVTESGLGSAAEEVNPLELLGHMTRVSRMGEGAIGSVDAIPSEARNVQPSHLGFVDPILTPESLKIGVDGKLAAGVRKGPNGELYAQFNDKSGKPVWRTPEEVGASPLAFNRTARDVGYPVRFGVHKNRMVPIHGDEAGHELGALEHGFSHLANLIPARSAMAPHRVNMAGRMVTQALALEHPEAPLVQPAVPGKGDRTYHEEYGEHAGAVKAKAGGRVVAVDKDGISVKGADGKVVEHDLADNLVYNRKSFLHNTPNVGVGDTVQPGQLLATSNYTDASGAIAVGKNLQAAYLVDRGHNFEDAVSLTESGAKKLSSVHAYPHAIEYAEGAKKGKNDYLSLFPSKYGREVLSGLDTDGVVKPGTRVKYGDPLVLQASPKDVDQAGLVKGRSGGFSDGTETWGHQDEGVVTDVEKTATGVSVVVKSLHPIKEGDKLSGTHGDKGVVARIIPDHDAPRNAAGVPFDILINPGTIPTRENPSQLNEAGLGKIAQKTGKRIALPDFGSHDDLRAYVLKELEKHGLPEKESVHDPVSGLNIKGVVTGPRFFMKLGHTAESKGQARGLGSYTADEQPAKTGGSEGSSKRLAMQEINALLSHGAIDVLGGRRLIGGQKNDDYHAAYMAGRTPDPPKIPFVHRKFFELLKAGGVHPVRTGSRVQVMAQTDKDVDELAGNRNIENADTVNWNKNGEPIRGGLFDVGQFGGHGGTRWGALALHEPMPSPIMEEPIRKVLGLTEAKFRDVLAGRADIGGKSGPGGLREALAAIDIDKESREAAAAWQRSRGASRDAIGRKRSYLENAKRLELHPKDWMLNRVPVLPPAYRPVSMMKETGRPLVADPNYLYRELWDANEALKHLSGRSSDVADERLAVYDAFKAVTGMGEPTDPRNEKRKVKGVLAAVFGSTPKFSFLQRKLLSSPVDNVGRAVISPDPDLDMDEIGIPEDKAWSAYHPFIVRRLARRGVPPSQAAREVKDRTSLARNELLQEMEARPVMATRAPTLHRYGALAFRPKLVKGETLRLPPMVYKGFGADNDGDAMNYHVIETDAGVRNALDRMLPSKNLLSARSFKAHMIPSNEFLAGLHRASTAQGSGQEVTFETQADAARAYYRGEIAADAKVVILNPDAKSEGEPHE